MSFVNRLPLIFVIFAFVLSFASADTCSSVAQKKIQLVRSGNKQYNTENDDYWSAGNSALKPSCILYPKNADEVAVIVKILQQNNETFAVKSGGHNPNKNIASINGGPLISTRMINEITPLTDGTVRVGIGNRWQQVVKALEKNNTTVVGGRMGNVGMGGYLLGGGLSFLSAQYGWAANSVAAWEVVMANGTVVNATADSHADLYNVLKGGGSGLGIVTRVTLKTYPIGQVWGGTLVFGPDQTPKLLAALRDFTDNYSDPKAGIIMTAEQTVYGALDIWILFLFYDGPVPPKGVFDRFTSLPNSFNSCKKRSYYDLLNDNNKYILHGSIYTIATETLPLPTAEHGAEVLGAVYNHWSNTTKSVLDVLGLIGSIAFQPLPTRIAEIARQSGGDMLDLDTDVARIIIELDYSYYLGMDNARVEAANERLYGGMKDRIDAFVEQGKVPDAYRPLFMNDAYWKQDVFARYRRPEVAAAAGKVYDAKGFFGKRTRGWGL